VAFGSAQLDIFALIIIEQVADAHLVTVDLKTKVLLQSARSRQLSQRSRCNLFRDQRGPIARLQLGITVLLVVCVRGEGVVGDCGHFRMSGRLHGVV